MYPVRRQIRRHAARLRRDRTTTFLEQRGYRVIRFRDNEVIESRDGVSETIRSVLVERVVEKKALTLRRYAAPPSPAKAGAGFEASADG